MSNLDRYGRHDSLTMLATEDVNNHVVPKECKSWVGVVEIKMASVIMSIYLLLMIV